MSAKLASTDAETEFVSPGRSVLAGVPPTTAVSSRAVPRHTHDLFGLGVIDRGGQRSASGCGSVEALRGDV